MPQPDEVAVVGGERLGRLRPGVGEHSGRHCDGLGACPEHDPTDHHMRGWPVHHGSERNLTVRTCPHGGVHPDPDDTRWPPVVDHGCDGCCRPPTTIG